MAKHTLNARLAMSSPTLLDETVAKKFLEKGGKWQTRQIVVFFLSITSTSFQIMAIVFTGFSPHFGCADKFNGTEISKDFYDGMCEVWNTTTNVSSSCSGEYLWDVDKHVSIVSDWDLVCSSGYMSETSQLLFTVGMAVGSFFVPPLSDRLGRRRLLLLVRFLYLLTVVAVVVIPNIIGFMVLRFLTGALSMATELIRFVYLMELSSVRRRVLVGILTGTAWSVNMCVLVLIAYLLDGVSWRILQAVLSVPALLVIVEAIVIKESLMWLYANDRFEEGSRLLREAMKVNGVTEEMILSIENTIDSPIVSKEKHITTYGSDLIGTDNKGYTTTEVNDTDYYKQEDASKHIAQNNLVNEWESDEAKLSLIDVLKNKTTGILTLIICYMWFTNSLVYYGIFFMASDLAGDRYLNFFLSSVVEFPSDFVLLVCLRFFGRKKPLVGLHGLCAVPLLLGGILMATLDSETRFVVMQIVTIIGKFGISTTFSLMYIYTSEVYPTNFRATGLGIGSTSARLGSFLTPYSDTLARKLPWAPGIIFGGICLILSLVLLWVPETNNRPLPRTLEDVEILKRDKKT